MPDSCCAIGCTNRRGDKPGLCLFRIPSERENLERRGLWITAIKREKKWRPSKYTRLCSEHFIKGAKSDDPLSPDWVPSIFSHTPATKKRKREKDMERYDQLNKMKKTVEEQVIKQEAVEVLLELSSMPDIKPVVLPVVTFKEEEEEKPCEQQQQPCEQQQQQQQCDEQPCENHSCKEQIARLQMECGALREENHRLKDIIKAGTFDELAFETDDKKVKTMTGISTYSKLRVVLSFVVSFLPSGTTLTPFQQLLLTLMRLKSNLPLSLLACIFKVSIPTASRTFRSTIRVLHARLVPALVFWPKQEELQLSMPMMLRNGFNKCACIIDCFEILIEKPTDLTARAQTYSKDKQNHTMKYLIGVTPQGTVSFISKGWGGRTSDKHLTERSGFLERLNPGDVILADRRLDVSESVGLYNAELKSFDFTRIRRKGSVEIESTRGFSSVRAYVNRALGEARNRYTILQSTIGIQICEAEHPKGLTHLDEIVHVCCALTNLAPSIVPSG